MKLQLQWPDRIVRSGVVFYLVNTFQNRKVKSGVWRVEEKELG